MLLLSTQAIDMKIEPRDFPRCWHCLLPVEKFRATDTGDSITFVAECHGQVELATIPDDMWDTVIGTHMNLGGYAFKPAEEQNDGE